MFCISNDECTHSRVLVPIIVAVWHARARTVPVLITRHARLRFGVFGRSHATPSAASSTADPALMRQYVAPQQSERDHNTHRIRRIARVKPRAAIRLCSILSRQIVREMYAHPLSSRIPTPVTRSSSVGCYVQLFRLFADAVQVVSAGANADIYPASSARKHTRSRIPRARACRLIYRVKMVHDMHMLLVGRGV